MTLVLNNAKVFRSGVFSRSSVSISLGNGVSRGGTISTMDASSFVILPGFVDVHVHLREPGFSYKETIRTGTLAAAHGGYTTVCAMPNLNPVPDSMETWQPELDAIQKDAVIRVLPYGAITKGEQGGELADLDAMAPYVVAFSDDGKGVQDRDMMRRAMLERQTPGQADRGPLRGQFPPAGRLHPRRRLRHAPTATGASAPRASGGPSSGIWSWCGRRAAAITSATSPPRRAWTLIRKAKAEGLNVTCETGPHYLLLDDSCLQEDGRFKMNPPLRDQERPGGSAGGPGGRHHRHDRHGPRPPQRRGKRPGDWKKAPWALWDWKRPSRCCIPELVKPGVISMERLMELLHDAPCRRFNIPTDTGFTVFDLNDSLSRSTRQTSSPWARQHPLQDGRSKAAAC